MESLISAVAVAGRMTAKAVNITESVLEEAGLENAKTALRREILPLVTSNPMSGWIIAPPMNAEGFWWMRPKKSTAGYHDNASVVLLTNACGVLTIHRINGPTASLDLNDPDAAIEKFPAMWCGPIPHPIVLATE